jgi:uncharacterized protein DUF6249
MDSLATAMVIVAVIGYFAFNQYLKHHRRVLISRERLAAIEKGLELPAVDQEVKRSSWNVQRLLLLCGLVWIALGIGAMVVLGVITAIPQESTKEIPQGIGTIGIAPIGIGIAHLITYWVGARRDRNEP